MFTTIVIGVFVGLVTSLIWISWRWPYNFLKRTIRRWNLKYWRSNPHKIQMEFCSNREIFEKLDTPVGEECIEFENVLNRIKPKVDSNNRTNSRNNNREDAVAYSDNSIEAWESIVKPIVKRLVDKSDYDWGRANPRRRLISSWRLVLAGDYCVACKNYEKAALYYHWAANQFRAVGQLDSSIEYYRKSAELYAKSYCSEPDLDTLEKVIRSAQRSIGVTTMVGETTSLWRDRGTPAEIIGNVRDILGDNILEEHKTDELAQLSITKG